MAVCRTALFAAAHGTLYRSVDAGHTWEAVLSSAVYVADSSATATWIGTAQGVYRSLDEGKTWSQVGFPTEYVPVLKARDSVVIAGTSSSGLQRSTDGGDTWTSVLNPGAAPYGLAYEGHTWFAGFHYRGIYRSLDDGVHWELVYTPVGFGSGLAVSGSSVLATLSTSPAVHRSLDGGTYWEPVTSTVGMDLGQIVLSSEGAFAAGDGVYRSLDQGATWQILPAGWLAITALAAEYPRVYAMTEERGLYGSTDGGTTWSQLGLYDPAVTSLSISGQTLYAASYDRGVSTSTDGGLTWQQALTQTARAVTSHGNNVLVATASGAYASGDAGASWKVGLQEHDVTQVALNGAALFAATSDDGLYRSTATGDSWQQVAFAGKSINVMVASRGVLYAAGSMGSGVWHSQDQGDSWQIAGLPGRSILELAADDEGMVAFDGAAVYWSQDGTQWLPLSGHPSHWYLAALQISQHRVYAATRGNSVWVRDVPKLALEPTHVEFVVPVVTPARQIQYVRITNAGAGTLQWTVSASGLGWLSILPETNTTPGQLGIAVTGLGLAVGTYSGEVTVSALGVVDASPQIIHVDLRVSDEGQIYLPCISKGLYTK